MLRFLLACLLAGLVAADTTGTQLPGVDYTFASDITGARVLGGAVGGNHHMHAARRCLLAAPYPPTAPALQATWP